MNWKEAAAADVASLKPRFAEKYKWRPEVHIEDDRVDLDIRLTGKRVGGKEYVLRLRYLSDWEKVGRREDFVNPERSDESGRRFWPPKETVRGVNPEYQHNGVVTPSICIKGVFGYHSVLHSAEPPDGTTLTWFLVHLQAAFNE
jgi:hypothetical protein